MPISCLLCAALLALTTSSALPASQARAFTRHSTADVSDGPDMQGTPPAPWVRDDPADSLYRAAREALNRNDYRRAAAMFDQITARYPKSAYAADALYYRGFALYRAGGESDLREALRALDAQHRSFPNARTIADADELRVRIRGELARRGDANSAEAVTSVAAAAPACPAGSGERDDDENSVRAAALNALLQMDSESAVPIIKQVLQKRDACSAAMRKKAVFLLSQKQTSETETIMINVVKNDPSREVREAAVFWLGQVHSEKAVSALEDLAMNAKDLGLRDKAIFALGQNDSPRSAALLRRLAENPDTPESIREKAVFQLGQHESSENAGYLRTLFTRLGKDPRNDALRRNVLFSLSQMRGVGNDQWLLGVALDNAESEQVRKQALFTAGQAGVPASELVGLYDKLSDRELKYQLIWVMSETRDRAGADKLVEIAQKDKDPEMRKKAIFWLGQKNDPRIRQILLDIISRP
ncbi:MAG: HEAT repeat domain-containing protein [bacterium]